MQNLGAGKTFGGTWEVGQGELAGPANLSSAGWVLLGRPGGQGKRASLLGAHRRARRAPIQPSRKLRPRRAGAVSVPPRRGQNSCLSEAGGATVEKPDRLSAPAHRAPHEASGHSLSLPRKEGEDCLAPAYSGVACQRRCKSRPRLGRKVATWQDLQPRALHPQKRAGGRFSRRALTLLTLPRQAPAALGRGQGRLRSPHLILSLSQCFKKNRWLIC